MFSDDFRKTKIVTCLIFVLILCGYSYFEAPNHIRTAGRMIKDPGRYPDRTLVKQCVRMTDVFANGFFFREKQGVYRAVYTGEKNMPDLTEGGYISVKGTLVGESLVFSHFHLHRYRSLKIVLSAVTMAIVCLYVIAASFGYLKAHFGQRKDDA